MVKIEPYQGVFAYFVATAISTILMNAVFIQLFIYTPLRLLFFKKDDRKSIGITFVISYLVFPFIARSLYGMITPIQEFFYTMFLPFVSADMPGEITINYWYFVPGVLLILLNIFFTFKMRWERIAETILVAIALIVYYASFVFLNYLETIS